MPTTLTMPQHLSPEDFLAMVEERPDGEHWELIEGIAITNPSPTEWHQQIVNNVIFLLMSIKNSEASSWSILPGVSTSVPASPGSLPRPDLFVKEKPARDAHTTDDGLIFFEVLSRSNKKADQVWRRRVYASIPNCQHYITISAKQAHVWRYSRATNWSGIHSTGLDASLELPAIEVTMKLRDIYRWTPIE